MLCQRAVLTHLPLQVASTCKKLAQAVADMLAKSEVCLELRSGSRLPPGLFSSRLVMSWAPHVFDLRLDGSLLQAPGHAAFMGAAQRLHTADVHSDSLASAASLDHLLSRCPSLTKLTCHGIHVPGVFPARLQELSVSFERLHRHFKPFAGAEELAEVLIIRLATAGTSLRRLELDLGNMPRLACETCLPQLQELRVSFCVDDEGDKTDEVALSWLQVQTCVRLYLRCTMRSSRLTAQQQALEEIQKLRVHRLSLRLTSGLLHLNDSWPGLQHVWQDQLSNCNLIYVHTSVLAHGRPELRFLPACPQLQFHIQDGGYGRPSEAAVIHWAALAGRPRRFTIRLGPCAKPRIVVRGFPGKLPFQGHSQPWQLAVYGEGVKVRGLPASCPCKRAAYLLQNQAAVAAGWADEADVLADMLT